MLREVYKGAGCTETEQDQLTWLEYTMFHRIRETGAFQSIFQSEFTGEAYETLFSQQFQEVLANIGQQYVGSSLYSYLQSILKSANQPQVPLVSNPAIMLATSYELALC